MASDRKTIVVSVVFFVYQELLEDDDDDFILPPMDPSERTGGPGGWRWLQPGGPWDGPKDPETWWKSWGPTGREWGNEAIHGYDGDETEPWIPLLRAKQFLGSVAEILWNLLGYFHVTFPRHIDKSFSWDGNWAIGKHWKCWGQIRHTLRTAKKSRREPHFH